MQKKKQAVLKANSHKFLPGGGACETALSLHLEDYARTLESKDQLAVAAFADSLMVIPTQLTCNAALDAIDLTSKLRVAHYAVQAVDEAMYEWGISRGLPVFMHAAGTARAGHFGSTHFRKLTKTKSAMVLAVLRLGYTVLFSDADVVWCARPTPHAHRSASLPDRAR